LVHHRPPNIPQDARSRGQSAASDDATKADKATWYVSFALQDPNAGHQRAPRQTRTFANEQHAKAFARALLDRTDDVSAGTINPHTPRRVIAPAAVAAWAGEV